jgi:hypothetical protein
MKQFKSGITFDVLLANFYDFNKIFICDYISYYHMEPYKNKNEEHDEAKKIVKYINHHRIFKRKFTELWPKVITMKIFKLKDYNKHKKECKF